MRPVRAGAVVLLLLGSVAASLPEQTAAAPGRTHDATHGGAGWPTRVIALGDSVATGAGCACSPFPVLVAADLAAPGRRVGLDRLAQDGATSDDVAAAAAEHLGEVSPTDVVLLQAGANDLAGLVTDDPLPDPAQVDAAAARAVATVAATVDRLVPTGARIVVLDYWAVGLDGDLAAARYTPAQRGVHEELTDAFDDRLPAALAADGGQVSVVGLRPVFHGDRGDVDPTSLLADDGDHPDARGQRAIADAVLAALTSEHAPRSPGIG
ncbi:SGNH/GDSL hydrolase family protein [Kineococcus sp. LSe6-4]|uniref:SGNH/GDSL hydrolase family protein n=1 Tax=Kineococcus halophytocola TaxID=3234027 RepID=A0ABV4H087_9ACTN